MDDLRRVTCESYTRALARVKTRAARQPGRTGLRDVVVELETGFPPSPPVPALRWGGMASPWHTRAGLALALLTFALVIATVIMLLTPEPPRAGIASSEQDRPTRAQSPLRVVERARRVQHGRTDDSACVPEGAACYDDDIWLLDSCGTALERLEHCEGGCESGSCRDVPPTGEVDRDLCLGLSEYGVCQGDLAVGCVSGQTFEIDCTAAGKRCVMTSEGAVCRTPSADDCTDAAPRCDEDTLRFCRDGRWETLDCRSQGGRCDSATGRCEVITAAASNGECGPCGCTSGPAGDEVCDGRDNDGDGEVDEDIDCDPVPIIFFVVGDRPGSSRIELEKEITRLDHIFAGDGDNGLRFTLLDVVEVDRQDWVDADSAGFLTMAQAELLHPTRDAFYVPIALVGSIDRGDVPKGGVSTIPNGVCGGQRRGGPTQLPVGLVAVADRRSPTTLAHEVGHFLGLCHTHQADAEVVHSVVLGSDGERLECDATCTAEGDGICDTPADPGIEACTPDRQCELTCSGDEAPDPNNIMSYYTWCRQRFTGEQLALMRTSLWLRRGWHRCITAPAEQPCECTPGMRECPEAMSCAPHPSGATCWLDGPLPPGSGPCSSHLECSQEAMCILGAGVSTCARACLLSGPGCTCVDVRAEVRACREDLPALAG